MNPQAPEDSRVDGTGDFESLVQARMAEILRFLLRAVLILLFVTAAINTAVEGPRWGGLATFAIAAGGVAALLAYARQGRPALAAIGLLLIFFIVAVGSIYLRGTTRIAATSMVIPAAALAGLFLERRALIVSLIICAALLGALTYAESAGLLGPAMFGSLVAFFSGLTAIAIATAVVLFGARKMALQGLRNFHEEIGRRRAVELALRRSELRFRGLTALSTDGHWKTDAQHRIAEFEPGAGFTPLVPSSNFIGKARWEIADLHPGNPRGWAPLREAMERHEMFRDFELSIGPVNGEVRWYAISGEPLNDADGSFLGYQGVTRQITERKRAEEELRSNRRLLENVIDALPMSVFAKDVDSNYIMLNKRVAEFFGLPKEELLRRHTSRLPSPSATRIKSLEDDAWVFRNLRTLDQPEVLLARPDGTQIPYHSTKLPLFDDAGKLIGLLGINRDITEEKRAQAALRESERRFRAVFERSRAGIAIWGLDGRFLMANDAYCEFVGYAADELVGKMKAGDLRAPGDAEGLELSGRMMRGEIAVTSKDRRFRRRDGSHVWGRTTVTAVTDDDGVLQHFVAVVIDITEAHEARERIERLNIELEERVRERTAELHSAVERLKEANRELDSFNSSIAHDLRQPLNAIGGFSDLLQEEFAGVTSDAAQDFAREIGANAARMEQMIEALLRFSNVGRGALNIVPIDMRRLVGSVLRELTQGAPPRVKIAVGELPAAHGDEALLRHVWSNLIGNALKYSSKAAAPRVEISGARHGGSLVYSVSDNGVGFDMLHAEHIFGVFERMPSASEFEGAGVGLAIAQRILRRHGGQISAESAPGQGATFRFTLPVQPAS